MTNWSAADIPRQTNKLVIITGANSGIGFETALALARAGAEIIIAGRSAAKNQAAIAKIKSAYGGANIGFEPLDLASLASVSAFTTRIKRQTPKLDILINNAGLMALPARQTTEDGFEMQLGTNFLGHFALTAQLMPLLTNTVKPRVIQLSSIAHKRGAIHLADLQSKKSYSPWKAYSQSKLAMLMFALELQRRSAKSGWGILSAAAHPGFARTSLIANGPGNAGLMGIASAIFAPLVSQSAAAGALPTLYAATAPGITPGFYAGPQGFMELRGPPGPAKIMKQAQDQGVARKLWDAAEALTGASFKSGR
jgi:NAD(P)-dependent dehydrogenase (short-subunit alcohol dehydrogenase family)